MKSKNFILIIIVISGLCLLSYVASRLKSHDNPQHAVAEHDEHDEHDERDEHEMHDEHASHQEHEQTIELTPEEIREIGLQTAIAGSGTLGRHINLTGEIHVNQDTMVHIVPRVEGVVSEVQKKLGDPVKAGEVIAVIESRELADAKAEYLAAAERYEAAKLSFDREEGLWKEKISSEEEYLDKKQMMTEADIQKRVMEQKLYAIGFDETYLQDLRSKQKQSLTRFEIKAPFNGTVIEKHIVLGELVKTESPVYVIADLSSVWVDLRIYPKELNAVKEGQKAAIFTDADSSQADGTISYVGPTAEPDSRTVLARVILPNNSGVFRPGLFVTAKIMASETQAKVVVPKEAVQSLEGKKCVFIKDEHGFEPLFVVTGSEDTTRVEIRSGLEAGQEYVTIGAFDLKAKIITSTLDSHAGHGH